MKSNLKKLIKTNYQQVIFVFLAFLAMVLVSYIYVSRIVQKQMLTIGEEMMNTTETAVTSYLKETELSFSNVNHRIESMLSLGNSNEEILIFLKDMNDYYVSDESPLPDFMKMYAYIRGEFLDGSGWVPPADYSPPQRPWHIGAYNNDGEIFFSEPYIDADTGLTCISFSQKVFDNDGNYYGIMAFDLDLTRITEYVGTQQLANNGYGILLSDTMNFTAHPDESLIGKNMSQINNYYSQLADKIKENPSISAIRITDIDGTDCIAFFRTVFNGWHIGVVTPRSSYYEQVYLLGLVLSILGIVLMSILSYILVRTRAAKMRSDEESKSKSEFLSRMSHEMRTPMNAIIGMTGIAKKSDDKERVQYCLDKIESASNHLLGVINDILDMSKIEAGKLEISETSFKFEKLIEEAVNVVSFKMDEKYQHFNITIDENVPKNIIADQQRLAQVITNLLSNANKFTPEHGNINLRVHVLSENDNLYNIQFEIIDNGIGISEEQQQKLFRSFEQADGSISRKFGGTGLGLSISKNIIDLMGGRIYVESEIGKGSRFVVEVNIKEDKNEYNEEDFLPKEVQEETVAVFNGKRALIAEDMEINREIFIGMLEDTGIIIDCAENGEEACKMFIENNGKYDIIFMDINMPELDGYEATKKIRAMNLESSQTVPIVAITANVFKEDIEKCLAAGMNDHIGKPFVSDEVISKMKNYIYIN